MYQEENEKRHESISSSDTPTYLPLRVNYIGSLLSYLRVNIKWIALWLLKWLSLVVLAFSLVLGFLIASNKNRCDRLLRFFGGDTTLESERRNHDSAP